MKTTLPILLAFFVLFQCTIKTIVVIGFYVNKEYIVQNLCENRDNAAMHCDGKCYLKKQLKDNGENQPPFTDLLKKKDEPLFIYTNKIAAPPTAKQINNCQVESTDTPCFPLAGKVFHPPKQV